MHASFLMRTYDREEMRHLNDGERFKDYEYLAEEFAGPNEVVVEPHLGDAESGRTKERVLGNLRGDTSEPPRRNPARQPGVVRKVARGAVRWAFRALGGTVKRIVGPRRRTQHA